MLKLGDYVRDQFLDLFPDVYNKIANVLVEKRKKRLAKKEMNDKHALGLLENPKDKNKRQNSSK